MVAIFHRYPRLTLLTLFLVIAAGLAALGTMGRQEDPSLVKRFGRVVTIYPGADAARVEALVTQPLENAILELDEVEEIDSSSRAGLSVISVQMNESLSETEVEQAWTKLSDQAALTIPLLPAEATQPEVIQEILGAATMIVSLRWPEGTEPNIAVLTRLAENLGDDLRNLSGTERVELYGEGDEEIRVLLDAEAAAAAGLSADDVARALAAADSKAPAGRLSGEDIDLNVEVAGEFDSVERVRAAIIAGAPETGFIRAEDIASISRGLRDPPSSSATFNGRPTIFVGAILQENLQADAWGAAATRIVEGFAERTPGVEVEIVFSQAEYVSDRLFGLARNLAFSALIVFAVLFLAMGWRSALIVGSALPLTILLVLILINIKGEPLHQMSVTGLVVALGLLIDNAIVIVDDYILLRRRGMARGDAVEKAIRTLFTPLLASTLTTVFAFGPIALMPGVAGEFISMIGWSVIFSVVSSFALAMTVIPAFAAWFDDGRTEDDAHSWWRDGLRSKPLGRAYQWLLDGIIARPWTGIALGLVLPVAGFAAATTLPSQFFPPTDRDMFQLSLTLPASASLEETESRTARATEMLFEYEDVLDVGWVHATGAPRTYYNVFSGSSSRPNFAAGWVRTRSEDATAAIVSDFQARAREAFPDARILALPFEQGPPTEAPIELKVFGPDLAVLDEIADEMRAVLSGVPGVTYTYATLERGQPIARLDADEASLALAGLSTNALAARLRAEIDGALGGSVLEGVQELPVRVIAPDDRRSAPGDVGGTPLPYAAGATPASVAAFGELELKPETAIIVRTDGQRVNAVRAYLEPYVLPAGVLAQYEERLAESGFTLPDGYELQIGGEAENQGDAMANLASTAVPLLILMIASVVLAFNSFRYAGIVFTVGFLSVGLAMFGVWLFNSPLGFNAIVGSLGLVGLSINGAIVVLTALKNSPAAVAGDAVAIRETVVDATRHILSTTLTTIGGFAPLLIEGDSFWLPFASAISGGVAGSAILALLFAPAAFVWLIRGEARRRARLEPRGEGGDALKPEPA